MRNHTAKQIHATLVHATSVLVVSHKNPDGDTLGSATALAAYLTDAQKNVTLFCATPPAKTFDFLPHINYVTQSEDVWHNTYDCIVVCDSGDLAYAGIDAFVAKHQPNTTIINIDHHKTNTQFGAYNLVDPDASSTCEILYNFFSHNNATITKDMATSLLTGIITDTDNFTNSATQPSTLEVGAMLLRARAEANVIKKHIYKSTPIHSFGLWAKVFERLTKHETLNICHTFIKHKDIIDHNMAESHITPITNFLNTLHDGHAGLLFKELEDGTVKGSFRTTRNDVDVAKIAQHFGGGGHKKAAGFTVQGPIHEAINYVFEEIEKLFPHGHILELAPEQAS